MDKLLLIDKVVKCVIEHNRNKELKDFSEAGYINDYNSPGWALNMSYWDWMPGVAIYGIYRAWRHAGRIEYNQYIKEWIDRLKNKAYGLKTVNATAPLTVVLGLYEETGNEEYLTICTSIADWIINKAPRTREGGLEHTVNEADAGFSEQIWADTLFMACIFLARLGRITRNQDYSNEAAKQLVIHHKLLKDKKTGLFYHGWNCESGNWMSGALWGRANAWIIASTVEMLEELPEHFEGREEVISSMNEQVKALEQFQRPNGMFGTLLDCVDSYDETSATAGIAYGIKRGIRKGYLEAISSCIYEKAEEAVIKTINDKGEVEGVSAGTPVMPSLEDYKLRPRLPILYGQGLALLMLCESGS